jgi:hypothetical protein
MAGGRAYLDRLGMKSNSGKPRGEKENSSAPIKPHLLRRGIPYTMAKRPFACALLFVSDFLLSL